MSLSIEQINKLQGENERLTKEVEQWKYEYDLLDACIELMKIKINSLEKTISRLTQKKGTKKCQLKKNLTK